MTTVELLILFGVPSAITGIGIWWIKRRIEHNEAKRQERESNLESLVLMMMQSTRSNNVGIAAIARAVQRIPDAHCNGDMDAALEKMEAAAKAEKDFLIEKGIKHIFE